MASWRAALLTAAVLVIVAATSATAAGIECPQIGNSTLIKPVCATSGRTYDSECLALKAGAKVKYQGTCLFPTKCNTKKYAPVCETAATKAKSKTWPTACVAKLNGVKKSTKGQCKVGVCAKCLSDTWGCLKAHKCGNDKRYICKNHTCPVKAITDKGVRLTVGGCDPVYYDAKTGYVVTDCLVPFDP